MSNISDSRQIENLVTKMLENGENPIFVITRFAREMDTQIMDLEKKIESLEKMIGDIHERQ